MQKLMQGYIHIYTGNGKGKSTAAVGLALRAAGAGLRVYILQLMKDFPYSEINSLKRFDDLIEVKQACRDEWVFKKEPAPDSEKQKATEALIEAESKMKSGGYDLIILDEVCVSIYFGLIDEERVIEFVKNKPKNVELILTGRYCSANLIELADLVTEMKEVKHYYQKGVLSRKGIDS